MMSSKKLKKSKELRGVTNSPALITSSQKTVVVMWGDITGFTYWSKNPLYSDQSFQRKIKTLYREFAYFEQKNSYFTKIMGDGIFAVQELNTHDKKNNPRIVVDMVRQAKFLFGRIEHCINIMRPPKPKGFRIRMAVGDVSRIEVKFPSGRKQVDYVGYPVNFAFKLLRMRPDIQFMAHETVKITLNSDKTFESFPVILRPSDYHGWDHQEIGALWDFSESNL